MTSEIRANTIKNRVGLGTVSYTDTGIVVSGIVTANSFSGAISATTGNFSDALTISSTTDQMLNLNSSDNNGTSLAFQRNGSRQGYIGYGGASAGLIIANEYVNGAVAIQGNDGGSIINMLSFASDNKGLATIHGGATIPLDLDVDGHTNLDNVSIAGVTTFTGQARFNGELVGSTISVLSGYSINIPDKLIHSGDTDTAIRFPANDTISMETAGSPRFRIEPAGSIGIGSAIHHLNDAGTEFGFPSNDAFFIKIANDSRFYVSNSTAVWNRKDVSAGVGTCTMLLNYNNAAGSGVALAFGPSTNYSVRHSSIEVVNDDGNNNMSMRFKVTDASVNDHALERMRITKDGYVGINTNASGNGSGAKLVVGGRIQSNAGGYWFAGASGAEDGWHVQDSGGNFVVVESGVAERLRIHSNGNVSIQTNDVGFSGAGTLRINSGSTAGVLNLDGGATNHGGEINLFGGSNGGRILFRTGQGGGQQGEKMRLDENGRLLIGGTSASYAFSGGDDLIIGNTNSGTRSGITLVSNSSEDGGIYFSDGTSSGNAHVQGQIVYDHGQHYMRFYSSSDEKFRIFGGTTDQVLQLRGGGNLSISDYAPNQTFSGTYTGYHTDNHGNTLIGVNAHLNYSGTSGTHQWKQTNAHPTIGSAGMFIGGNGSNNNTSICFFRNSQGGSAGQTYAQDSWKFQIGSALRQNFNLQYLQRGYFKNDTSNSNASNNPLAAGSGIGGYSWGFQEAFSTSNGSWVYPYPNLVLGYHTGMMFGGNYGYGGMRFFADHPNSNNTLLFSVGNGNTNCHVVNSLSKGGGSFRIAHPHPSKKYTHDLVHSFIEGPQCDNIYRGRVMLVNGSKTINIDTVSNMTDGTFVLLNRDIQCFTSNESGWTPVKGTVSGNILTITAQDNTCTDTISWMVIGERQDDKIKSLDMTDKNGDLIVEPLTIEETHM